MPCTQHLFRTDQGISSREQGIHPRDQGIAHGGFRKRMPQPQPAPGKAPRHPRIPRDGFAPPKRNGCGRMRPGFAPPEPEIPVGLEAGIVGGAACNPPAL